MSLRPGVDLGRWTVVVVVLGGVLLVALAGAYLLASDPASIGENRLGGYPHAPVPSSAAGPPVQVAGHSVQFTRPSSDTRVFDFWSHDPMLAVENGTYYAIVGSDRRQLFFRSRTPTDPASWQLLDDDYLSRAYEFDSMVAVDGRYVAYADGRIYTTSSLTDDEWVRRSQYRGLRDLGAHYDEETGLVHVYYEYGVHSQSGTRIGHAVSPDGVTDWTVYPTVWTAPSGYGVGDFEVVERGDRVFLLGDYGPKHPNYDVGVWVNDDYYSPFTKLDRPAVDRRPGGTPSDDAYGIGDPAIARLGDGRYLMLANGHASASARSRLHYYVGTIETPNGSADARDVEKTE